MIIEHLRWSPRDQELKLTISVSEADGPVQPVIDAYERHDEIMIISRDRSGVFAASDEGRRQLARDHLRSQSKISTLEAERDELRAKLDKLATLSPRMSELQEEKAVLSTRCQELSIKLFNAELARDKAEEALATMWQNAEEITVRGILGDFEEWSSLAVVPLEVERYLFAKYPKAPTLEEKYAELLEAVNGADSVAEGVELLKTFVGGLDDE